MIDRASLAARIALTSARWRRSWKEAAAADALAALDARTRHDLGLPAPAGRPAHRFYL